MIAVANNEKIIHKIILYYLEKSLQFVLSNLNKKFALEQNITNDKPKIVKLRKSGCS